MQEMTIRLGKENIRARVANSFTTRFKGLMGEDSLPQGEAMIFDSFSIHMLFMKFPIDAVFLDKNGIVVDIHKCLLPWTGTATCRTASYVIELPAGDADRLGVDLGQTVEIQTESFGRKR